MEISFPLEIDYSTNQQVTEQVTEQVKKLLSHIEQKEYTRSDLMELTGLKHRPTFLYKYLQPALELKLIEMTIPEKPKSSLQNID